MTVENTAITENNDDNINNDEGNDVARDMYSPPTSGENGEGL